MKKLIAAASDGWGIVEDGEGYWLVRPPYRQVDRDRLALGQVERAVLEEDFVLEREPGEFAGWGALCRHLQAQVSAGATAAEKEAAPGAAGRILARATAEQARAHLDRLERRLEEGQPGGVELVLIALLGSAAVIQEPALVSRVAELLGKVRDLRPRLHAPDPPQRQWLVADETAVSLEAAAIRDRRSLLVPAA